MTAEEAQDVSIDLANERPDALLRSALEKIVYFEARSTQLQNDLSAARLEAGQLKNELASASQREIELRRENAGLQVQLHRSHQEKEEIARRSEALRAERADLIGKLVEASQIQRADAPESIDDDTRFNLAGFIAELRSEVISHRQAAVASKASVPQAQPVFAVAVSGVHRGPSGISQMAEKMLTQGRLNVSSEQMRELSQSSHTFAGRTEETVFGFSVRELSAPDFKARIRAAERLQALKQAAAAPALATALHGESDFSVQVALLNAFAVVANAEGAAVVSPMLNSSDANVRMTALKALMTLNPAEAALHLKAAIHDADHTVRRRASLMALGLSGEGALTLGREAASDSSPEVRSLAALVLGASGGEGAKASLLEMLCDREEKVRKAAAQSLSRQSGQNFNSLVGLDSTHRRREVRRFANSTPVTSLISEPLCSALMSQIRMSLRGQLTSQLAITLNLPEAQVKEGCDLLVARGQAVTRGLKYFTA